MTDPERQPDSIDEILKQARWLGPEELKALLDRACGDDEVLKAEILAQLATLGERDTHL